MGIKYPGRIKQGVQDIINISLNYGYAILRARALVCAGFCINFGIGHHRKGNPFNLVEDFMETFRPFIDKIVFSAFIENEDRYQEFTPLLKSYIINAILGLEIQLEDKYYRVFNAIDL